MSIKEHKIFVYNNYSNKEIDTIVKLIINIEEIMRDRFIYEMSWMKNQDLILRISWLRNIDTWVEPESPILVFLKLNIRISSLLLILDIQSIRAAAYMAWKKCAANSGYKVQVFTASIADINKALCVKEHSDSQKKLFKHFHYYL